MLVPRVLQIDRNVDFHREVFLKIYIFLDLVNLHA